MNDSLLIIAQNLAKDQAKLSRLYRRYPLYLEELAKELIPPRTTEVGDEEIALSLSQMKEELSASFLHDTSEGSEFLSAQEPIL